MRKLTHNAVSNLDLFFRSLYENSFDAVLLTKPDGIILAANPAACELFSKIENELLNSNRSDLVVVDEKCVSLLNERKRTGKARGELTLKRKGGSTFEGEVTSTVFVDVDGSEKTILIIRDITERKKTEERLLQRDLIFEKSLDMICMAGFDGYFKVLNPAWSSTLGWSPKELLSKPWIEFVHPDDREATVNARARLIDGKEVFQFENRYMCKDGRVRWLSWNSFPYPEYGSIFAVARDITDRREADHRLAAANEKLRVIGSLTRHDVRNKLSGILSNAYLLKKNLKGDPKLEEYVRDIENGVEASNKLFEFSSNYEKIGVEQRSEVDVGQFFRQAVALHTDLQKMVFQNECDGFVVTADSLLRQIFYNLIDNSVKHGKTVTKIRLTFNKTPDGISLVYEDNGVGISEANKPHMFVGGFTTGNGSGLGLMLVKKIVEAYGWTITEEGKPGSGVKFVIHIANIKPTMP